MKTFYFVFYDHNDLKGYNLRNLCTDLMIIFTCTGNIIGHYFSLFAVTSLMFSFIGHTTKLLSPERRSN